MQDSLIFIKKGISHVNFGEDRSPGVRKPYYRLETRDAEFVVYDHLDKAMTLRVPNATKLDAPEGLLMNAVDGCVANIPCLQDFWVTFASSYNPANNPDFDFSVRLLARTSPAVNFDNPGHVLLAMRGLKGDDICKAHAAYIRALAVGTCPVAQRNSPEALMDPKRLLWFHAGICKLLGACYYAQPIPPKSYPTCDHIAILFEILKRAAYPMLRDGSMPEGEKADVMRALRYWHCPRYVRDKNPDEARRWSFDRPRERAESIVSAMRSQQIMR